MSVRRMRIAPPGAAIHGYARRRLVVDLPALDAREEALDQDLLRDYLGGRGLNVQYLHAHRDPTVDPLDPSTPILFATGPFAGTLYPGGSRFNVTGPSPQTGLLGDSNAGGFWASALKNCGLDQLVVTGKTEGPAVLALTENEVALYQLPEIAELTVKELLLHLHGILPGRDWQVLASGPAATRGVKYAGLFANGARAAARTGMGTLLASKGLRAVALGGNLPVGVSNPRRFQALLRKLEEEIYAHPEYLVRTFMGTTKLMSALNQLGALSTRHYTSGVFDRIDDVSGETVARTYKKRSKACHGCPIPCSRSLEVDDGPGGVDGALRMEGPEFEGLAGFTSKLGISDLAWALWAVDYCNEQGIDAITTSECLAVSMESYERGLIGRDQTGGLDLRFGNKEAAAELLRQIAEVRGFGARFRDGALAGGRSLGHGVAALVMHVKGLDIFQADPRGMKAYALGVAVASRGGDHLRSEPWLEFSDDEEQAVRRFGKPEVAHRLEHAGKGLLVKHYEDKAAISDGLEVCKNTFNNMELPTYDAAAELYEALTGIPMDAETLELAGERIVTVERLYNLAHGLTPADDTLPDRFTSEPLEEGGSKGETVDIERLKTDYYRARDWSLETGRPSRAKLQQLGL